VLSGWLADRIGRKWTKILSGSVYVLGALGCAFAVNVPMLVAFRAMLGFSVGTASFVSPMYISEVAPPKARGGLTSFNQLAITTGIAVAYLVNYTFKDVSGNWRWMLGIAVLPGAALAIGMLTVPRTPRWLVEQGQDGNARAALRRLRAGTGTDPDAELDEIRESSERAARTSLRDLARPPVRRLLIIGLGLAIFQQIVGVNTVIYYAPTILQQTGLGAGNAITQTLTVGLTNVVFTIVAILLLDRVGRRPLLIAGTTVAGAALLGLAAYFGFSGLQNSAPWLALASLLVFIAGYAVGLGPVFWLMISEIFPQRLRSKSMSVTTVVNWLANFAVSATFLTLTGAITRQGIFIVYAVMAVAAVAFFARTVPETKGRSLEDMQHDAGSESEHPRRRPHAPPRRGADHRGRRLRAGRGRLLRPREGRLPAGSGPRAGGGAVAAGRHRRPRRRPDRTRPHGARPPRRIGRRRPPGLRRGVADPRGHHHRGWSAARQAHRPADRTRSDRPDGLTV
jgi:sugar porter (SP) family MFS transporter